MSHKPQIGSKTEQASWHTQASRKIILSCAGKACRRHSVTNYMALQAGTNMQGCVHVQAQHLHVGGGGGEHIGSNMLNDGRDKRLT